MEGWSFDGGLHGWIGWIGFSCVGLASSSLLLASGDRDYASDLDQLIPNFFIARVCFAFLMRIHFSMVKKVLDAHLH